MHIVISPLETFLEAMEGAVSLNRDGPTSLDAKLEKAAVSLNRDSRTFILFAVSQPAKIAFF